MSAVAQNDHPLPRAPHRPLLQSDQLPVGLSLSAQQTILDAPRLADENHYLPYYKLLDLAPAFELTLTHISRHSANFPALEYLIAMSIAEALDSIPILSVRFWRALSLCENVCAAASMLLDDSFAPIQFRLQEDLTFFGLAQDPDTRFENIFPNLWTGPKYTMSGQVAEQIEPDIAYSLRVKIGSGVISTETTGLRAKQISNIVDVLTTENNGQPKGNFTAAASTGSRTSLKPKSEETPHE